MDETKLCKLCLARCQILGFLNIYIDFLLNPPDGVQDFRVIGDPLVYTICYNVKSNTVQINQPSVTTNQSLATSNKILVNRSGFKQSTWQ